MGVYDPCDRGEIRGPPTYVINETDMNGGNKIHWISTKESNYKSCYEKGVKQQK